MSQPVDLAVEHPAGGILHMQTAEEVDLWRRSLQRYREDFVLAKINDLFALGQLLQSQIMLFRAQTAINGMVPELDEKRVPTGRYTRKDLDGPEMSSQYRIMQDSSKEMRALEKQLGIDKATREQGGTHTVSNYISTLKKAAHSRGIHINQRTIELESFRNALNTKIRMLYKLDAEDRAYHNISPKSVLDWTRDELEKLEKLDIEFAKDFGKLYVGEL